ncbi:MULTISPECIES: DUF2844 domain-containing protein [unclassified Duganella]|uniref:DUF2844 domain-containing protein n=1 Tax=unclassified Duganella TaxID=2636909 RepID=UPI000E3416BF|nr:MULTISPECIES: DUF2844 domain-containing protein [unclassified Duganella]RFP14718.1 DUF2844 domain-containing protein [Duganella sp. BJB475]RFP31067.1 DUF2844 domain-containing protein [Duganella sp. BJB476]
MRRALLLMLLLPLLQGALAYAALGTAPSNFGTTPVRQGGRSLAAATTDSTTVYTVSQSTLDSGTVVREYVNTQGTVFAVSWNGPALPDLRTLLGDKFAVLTTAAGKRPKAGHSQLAVEQSDLVIVSGGHMRAYAGHAWIPSALPAGFDTSIIE